MTSYKNEPIPHHHIKIIHVQASRCKPQTKTLWLCAISTEKNQKLIIKEKLAEVFYCLRGLLRWALPYDKEEIHFDKKIIFQMYVLLAFLRYNNDS
jgi:hypothetical protein